MTQSVASACITEAAGAAGSVRAARDAIAARRWLDASRTMALATVIDTWGSSPVSVGGHLVVGPGEHFEGSVSRGGVEAAVIVEALGVIASGTPKALSFGVSDETAWEVGLPCGGAKGPAEIAVSLLSAVIPARRCPDAQGA